MFDFILYYGLTTKQTRNGNVFSELLHYRQIAKPVSELNKITNLKKLEYII